MKLIRGKSTQFDFTGANGSALNVKSIGVLRVDRGGPMWWIVSDEYADTWEVERLNEVLGKAAEEQRAQLDRLLGTETGGRMVSRVTYGQVPAGFRQIVPEQGPPEPLEQGGNYILHTVGREFAAHEFNL